MPSCLSPMRVVEERILVGIGSASRGFGRPCFSEMRRWVSRRLLRECWRFRGRRGILGGVEVAWGVCRLLGEGLGVLRLVLMLGFG